MRRLNEIEMEYEKAMMEFVFLVREFSFFCLFFQKLLFFFAPFFCANFFFLVMLGSFWCFWRRDSGGGVNKFVMKLIN